MLNCIQNAKLYKHFLKLGVDHFEIKLIKLYPCNDRIELDIEEERIKILLNAQLNTYRAHQTVEQRKEQKKNGVIEITKYGIKKIEQNIMKAYYAQYVVKSTQDIIKQNGTKNVYN
jgi:hypothetical protein